MDAAGRQVWARVLLSPMSPRGRPGTPASVSLCKENPQQVVKEGLAIAETAESRGEFRANRLSQLLKLPHLDPRWQPGLIAAGAFCAVQASPHRGLQCAAATEDRWADPTAAQATDGGASNPGVVLNCSSIGFYKGNRLMKNKWFQINK